MSVIWVVWFYLGVDFEPWVGGVVDFGEVSGIASARLYVALQRARRADILNQAHSETWVLKMELL